MNTDQLLRDKLLDVSQSFLVQAPAGSGKTSILVQRYLCALANARNGPEEIIAITFTRKAAAEMRERILNALHKAHDMQPPESPYQHKMWELAKKALQRDKEAGWNILDNPKRLKIQTIDALCTSITKQMPILSRFGAEPQIATHVDELYIKAVDDLLNALDGMETHAHVDALIKLLKHLDNDRSKVRMLLQQALQSREHWLPLLMQHRGSPALRRYLEQGLSFACAEAIADLEALRPQILNMETMQVEEPRCLKDWLEISKKLLTSDGTWRKTVTEKQGFPAPSKAKSKEEKIQLQRAKEMMLLMLEKLRDHDSFRQALALLPTLPPETYTDKQWEITEALIILLPILAAQLSVVFRDSGQVDFVAVALGALAALQDDNAPSDLAVTLDCKIQHILVDEFQDTSHIQFKLLEQLTANWEEGDGRTLFLVGDPMQSIYSFRHADVGLFIKARENGVGNVSLEFVQLSTNFRSSAVVIDWINNVFKHSFPAVDNKTLGAISYTPAVATSKNDDSMVTCVAVNNDTSAQIINIIQHTKMHDPNASIAILVRNRSHLQNILPALRAAKIPFQGIDIEILTKRQLLQDLLALTRAILHLDDRIAWLAILRAPWCGLYLSDLEIISQHQGTIFEAINDPDIMQRLDINAKTRVRHVAEILASAIALLGRYSIKDLIIETALNLGVMDCLRHDDEVYEFETFKQFLEQIGSAAEIYNPGCLEAELQKLYLQSQPVAGAVQIMTIHKAKGLEFDVVIVPELDKSTKAHDQEILLLEQRDYDHQYLLLAPIREAFADADPIYSYLALCRKQRSDYETLREFYVAVTRAKKYIYCLAQIDNETNVGGMLKHVWSYIRSQFNVQHAEHAQVLTVDKSIRRLPDRWFQTRQEPHLEQVVKVTAKHKPWRSNWVNQAGNIVHKILCHIARTGAENISQSYLDAIPVICANCLRTSSVSAQEHSKVHNVVSLAVTKMLNDPFGRNILSKKHKEGYTEWDLTEVDGLKFNRVRLDRVFIDANDVCWLIDYKIVLDSDFAKAIDNYKEQLGNYARILSVIKPNYELKYGIYFPLQAHWEPMCTTAVL